jgi:hypothetical protein
MKDKPTQTLPNAYPNPKIVEQGAKNLKVFFDSHLDLLSDHLSPDSLSNSTVKEIPQPTKPSNFSTHTSPTDMIIDSNFSVEQFSTQEQAGLFTAEASENLTTQNTPSEANYTPPPELQNEPESSSTSIDFYQPPLSGMISGFHLSISPNFLRT